jgi:hypothetical protein
MVKLTKSAKLKLPNALSGKDKQVEVGYIIDEKTGIKLHYYHSMPNQCDLLQIMEEQGYKGVDWQEIDRLVAELDIQESVEELTKQLTR